MTDREKQINPHLILPVGTQVVTRMELKTNGSIHPAGAVGVITEAPADATHSYRVRFPDGGEAMLRRSEISIRKHAQRAGLEEAPAEVHDWKLYEYVIYRCVVGSRAYGLSNDESDVDRRGIYLPPADLQWSLYGVPEQLEDRERDEVYWELQKFITLALKANPNILECLHTPLVELTTPVADQLLSLRSIFLSTLVYQTYNGYVLSQFKLLERDLRTKGEIKWKHAMHLIRLLISGITILRDGFVPVDIASYRDRLLSIRQGTTSWDEVEAWRLDLHQEFDRAFVTTSLPDRPDYARANDFLIAARRSMI
jgi:predicted nucleotidyltransferase